MDGKRHDENLKNVWTPTSVMSRHFAHKDTIRGAKQVDAVEVLQSYILYSSTCRLTG